MSIRRKSCDSCFNGRRKCDLGYPVCARCQKNNRTCHYVYPPQLPERNDDTYSGIHTTVAWEAAQAPSTGLISSPSQPRQAFDGYFTHASPDLSSISPLGKVRHLSIPRALGNLGELCPISGTKSEIVKQLQELPVAFAVQSETIFIHKTLYGSSFPQPLRAAFGICAGCIYMNDRNRSTIFQALDAEVSNLLMPALTSTLLDHLVRLQAAVLYQIIRLFYGGMEQRRAAEEQEFLVRSYALKLIRRADDELQNTELDWETWLLAESIRRTAFLAFKVYTIYSEFRYGECTDYTAMMILPVTTKLGSWSSREMYLQYPGRDETTTYGNYASIKGAELRGDIGPFERLLVMGCPKLTNMFS